MSTTSWRVASTADHDLAAWIRHLPTLMATAAIVHQQRNLLVRTTLPDGRAVVVKRWQGRGWGALRRAAKAERSYIAAQRLIELGLPTPTPIAWASHRDTDGMHTGWYVCCERSPAPTLYRWLHPGPDDHGWRERVEAAGALAARLHAAGVWQRDLTPGNLIAVTNADTNADQWELVDLNRITFQSQPVAGRRAWANLALLNSPAAERNAALIAGYARAAGVEVDTVASGYAGARRWLDWLWAVKDGTRPLRRWLKGSR